MALKNWKKDGKDIWYSYDSRGLKKVLKIVKLSSIDFPNKQYYVWSSNVGWSKWRYFKTKSQALKFVKSYMKTH